MIHHAADYHHASLSGAAICYLARPDRHRRTQGGIKQNRDAGLRVRWPKILPRAGQRLVVFPINEARGTKAVVQLEFAGKMRHPFEAKVKGDDFNATLLLQ